MPSLPSSDLTDGPCLMHHLKGYFLFSEDAVDDQEQPVPLKRGRPKGSKTKILPSPYEMDVKPAEAPVLHNPKLRKNRVAQAALKGTLATRIEEDFDRSLTERQKTFAELYVEGLYTNTECARRAGFNPETANVYARRLLSGVDFPHVVQYIKELREAKERKYGVTTIGQLERLYNLSRGAEEAKQFSAAINAEKLRSALGGLTTDRRETLNRIENMSRDQIMDRLMELQNKYPFLRDITPNGESNGTGSQTLESPEAES